MADDDDKPKKHTLESLFHLYCNYAVVSGELDNVDYDCILLSQIDYWLDQAKLLKTTFSLTETGLTKWRLDYEEFQEFIDIICTDKTITADEVKAMLLEAGVPGTGADTQIVHDYLRSTGFLDVRGYLSQMGSDELVSTLSKFVKKLKII